MRAIDLRGILLGLVTLQVSCGSSSIGRIDDTVGQADGGPDVASIGQGGAGNQGGAPNQGGAGSHPEDVTCCPRDTTMSGCMRLGGRKSSPSVCEPICEYYCSDRWRIEKDEFGCEVWRFDLREPRAGEDRRCLPVQDGGQETGANAVTDGGREAKADGVRCCPRDPVLSGCMSLGGTDVRGDETLCRTCDFWCSENWRVEKDDNGCEVWRYDRRMPKPGENQSCIVPPGGDH